MQKKIVINKCTECPDCDHTGAFTKNGALGQCRHKSAPNNFTMSNHTGDKKDNNYRIAKLNPDRSIPK